MLGRIKDNLKVSLPVGIMLGLWFSLIDCFQVVISSSKLLEHPDQLLLLIAYGYMTTLVVTLAGTAIISALLTCLDFRKTSTPAQNAGRSFGTFIFLLLMGLTFLLFRSTFASNHPLDPRILLPALAILVVGWGLARLLGRAVTGSLKPEKWVDAIAKHYSITAGILIFAFGTFAGQYNLVKEEVYHRSGIALTPENFIIYAVCIVAGILTWWGLKKLLLRPKRNRGTWVIGTIIGFILIPLVLFMRPAPPNDPDIHSPKPSEIGMNVILISIDTLRYDRLGCNDNDTIQTPNIDALARESVIFDNCIVPIPLTLPSHASMVTGKYPRNHGLRVNDYHLNTDNLTVAEHLSEKGFTTGGIVSMSLLRAKNSRFNQGFDYYDDFWVYRKDSKWFPLEVKFFIAGRIINKLFTGVSRSHGIFERRGDKGIDSAIDWLDAVKDDDFFGFFHIFDPHWDYNAPDEYKTMYDPDYDESGIKFNHGLKWRIWDNKEDLDDADINHIIARYDGEVTYTDHQLGRLFAKIRELGLWDETMIILTADHGESFEHDYWFAHADRVYQSNVHVPLIIKPPGGANGERIDALCTNADFFPTICDVLGISTPSGLDGVSLAEALDGLPEGADFVPHEVIFTESYAFDNYNRQHYGKTFGILRDRWKLIYSPFAYPYAPRYQLYDLVDDPEELNDVFEIYAADIEPLIHELDVWVEAEEDPAQGLLDRAEREAMEGLQYFTR